MRVLYKNNMIITMSGNAGSGKSTVAKILAVKLNFKRYYMGQLRRDAARKRGMTLEEYNKLGESDPSTDNDIDEYQKKLGKTEDNFIIEGRTSYHFIPQSFKIYLKANPDVGATRIWKDLKDNSKQRNEANVEDIDQLKISLAARQKSDELRYMKYYSIKPFDELSYDLVVDTSFLSVKEVVEKIITSLPSVD